MRKSYYSYTETNSLLEEEVRDVLNLLQCFIEEDTECLKVEDKPYNFGLIEGEIKGLVKAKELLSSLLV